MKSNHLLTLLVIPALLMVGCGKEEDKLGQLKSLKEQKKEIEAQIVTLEKELNQ